MCPWVKRLCGGRPSRRDDHAALICVSRHAPGPRGNTLGSSASSSSTSLAVTPPRSRAPMPHQLRAASLRWLDHRGRVGRSVASLRRRRGLDLELEPLLDHVPAGDVVAEHERLVQQLTADRRGRTRQLVGLCRAFRGPGPSRAPARDLAGLGLGGGRSSTVPATSGPGGSSMRRDMCPTVACERRGWPLSLPDPVGGGVRFATVLAAVFSRGQ